jgi:type IV pilus assembly protein PilF
MSVLRGSDFPIAILRREIVSASDAACSASRWSLPQLTAVVCILVALGGCVTEHPGAPEPASKEARVQAQINLARGYLDSDDPSRARTPLEHALDIDPNSADALGLFAVFYQREEEPELAEQYYKRAMRANPAHPANLNNYAVMLYSQGRYQEALRPLESLVEITSYRGRAMAFENLGLTRLKLGETADARAAFGRALGLNPDLSASNLEIADLAFQAGDYPTALKHYDSFRARSRQSPRSLCLGINLARAVNDANQRASYEVALRNLYPQSTEALQCVAGG